MTQRPRGVSQEGDAHKARRSSFFFVSIIFTCVHAQLAPWTVAREALLSLEFSRQEYWSGVPFSTPGNLPDPGMEPGSPASVGGFFTTAPPGKPQCLFISSLRAGPGLRCGSGFL